MSELYTITEFQVTVDQANHPDKNYAQFIQQVNGDLVKFQGMLMNLQSEFIAPQDVGGVAGLSCRIHAINGYPAIRQISQYDPKSKSWVVYLDCRVLTRAPEAVKADGDVSAKLDTIQLTPKEAPASDVEPDTSDAKVH